jgi:hypothetical protein
MKKLKQSLVFFFAVAIMSTAIFTSCEKDGPTGNKKILMSKKWEMSTIETSDEDLTSFFDFTYNLVKTTYEFQKNDKLTITYKVIFVPAETEEGTWSISDDGTKLTINGETSDIIELTSKVLKMGPNSNVLGGAADDESDISLFSDYVIVFEAK